MEGRNFIDNITDQIVFVLESGRENINVYEIRARSHREKITTELEKFKKKVQDSIEQIAHLQVKEKQSKLNLLEISRNNHKNYENDFLEAYEKSRELQITLGIMLEKEKQFKIKRDGLETELKKLDQAIDRSRQMYSKMGFLLDYLLGRLPESGKITEGTSQRQVLGLKIILAQEEERRRVAREIHDGPAQSMANLVLRTEICEKIMDTKPGEVREELGELKTMVRNSLQEIRKIIFDLRPMALDDLGIIATLKRFVEDYRDKTSLNIEFSTSGVPIEDNKDLEIAVFRIIQEALNNVFKHADASDVIVKVDFYNENITISVSDNGRGFDLSEKHPEGSYGLIGMKERIDLLQGTMNIKSAPGKGTKISVVIPLKIREKNKAAGE